jgi:hypothetical protein
VGTTRREPQHRLDERELDADDSMRANVTLVTESPR